MKIEEYRDYLQSENVSEEVINKHLAVINDFITFLAADGKDVTSAGEQEVKLYTQKLIDERKNDYQSFLALHSYTDWLDQRDLFVAFIWATECHNAMAVLADIIGKKHGKEVHDKIFLEELPPTGADELERYAHTRTITERMAQELIPEASRAAWYKVQHGIPERYWNRGDTADREKFRRCGSIDEFLKLKQNERNERLTRLCGEGKLWYTQEINNEVLEFATNNPETEVGRREGDKIYITKIPYNALKYLHATDEKMKRYYACHCPLVREAILRDEAMSTDVCECSLGHASHYVAGLGQELKGEVLESVLKGDMRCRFVFCLPSP